MAPNGNGIRAPVFSHFTIIENSNGSLGNFQAVCKICKKKTCVELEELHIKSDQASTGEIFVLIFSVFKVMYILIFILEWTTSFGHQL